MPKDPFIREKFTKERTAAKKLSAEYFERFPKDRYQTEVDSWQHLQSANSEFTMKRLREPIEILVTALPVSTGGALLALRTMTARGGGAVTFRLASRKN
jgi:hypothetical protein